MCTNGQLDNTDGVFAPYNAPSVTNMSITGSYLVTTICSEQLMNTSLTTIAGGLIEVLAR